MHPTPAALRRIIAFTMALVIATASCIIPAQTIPRQPTADSTHTYRNWGVPKDKSPVCNAGFVLSGETCVALNTGAGATLLPHDVPQGTYTNRANYPLLVAVSPAASHPGCFHFWAYVDYQQIAHESNGCDSGPSTITFMVPSGSTFSWNSDADWYQGTARITALTSGAKWEDTQIGFYWLQSQSTVTTDGTWCSLVDITTNYWVYNYNNPAYPPTTTFTRTQGPYWVTCEKNHQ